MLTPKSAGGVVLATAAATILGATYAFAAPGPPPPPPPPPPGGNWNCPGGPMGCAPGGNNGNPPPAPPPWTPPADIAAGIRAAIGVPSPVIYTTPKSPTYVRVKTSFWIGPGVWAAVVSPPGGPPDEQVTVTAAPKSLDWDFGDQAKLTCYGPGSSTDLTNCIHVYQRSSANMPNGKYTVNTVLNWDVTWVCVGVNCRGQNGGALQGMTSQANAQLQVGEIQGNSGQ